MHNSMKKTCVSIGALLALATGVTVLAAPTAELTIAGTITPPACTISLTNSLVDFGEHRHSSLVRGRETTMDTRTTELNIQCDGATRASFSLKDNRKQSVPNGDVLKSDFTSAGPQPYKVESGFLANYIETNSNRGRGFEDDAWAYDKLFFGLGLTGTGRSQQRIGYISIAANESRLRIVNAEMKNSDAVLLEGDMSRPVWGRSKYVRNGVSQLRPDSQYAVDIPEGIDRPLAFRSLTLPLSLQPTISSLNSADKAILDGSVTFTLHYL